MVDRPETSPEGWEVPQRPAIYAACVTIAVLVLMLLASGYLYDHYLRQATYRQPVALPSPGLETAIHPAALDPDVARRPQAPDPEITAAKQRVAAQGLTHWERGP